jgi:hypothetical protein
MTVEQIDVSIPSIIQPGTQVERKGFLYELADYVGKQKGVRIEPMNILVAQDHATEPTFMYSFGPVTNEIWLVAFGGGARRYIDVGHHNIHTVNAGKAIADAIDSLQEEFRNRSLPRFSLDH